MSPAVGAIRSNRGQHGQVERGALAGGQDGAYVHKATTVTRRNWSRGATWPASDWTGSAPGGGA
jgi:hypothetical protein